MDQQQLEQPQVELKVSEESPAVADAVPSFVEKAETPRSVHSLLHGMGKSGCTANWRRMIGTEQVRKCRICDANTYRIDGMDEQQLREQFEENEQTLGTRLYRRPDGTVSFDKGQCGSRLRLLLVVTYSLYILGALIQIKGISIAGGVIDVGTLIMLLGACVGVAATRLWDRRLGLQTWLGRSAYCMVVAGICQLPMKYLNAAPDHPILGWLVPFIGGLNVFGLFVCLAAEFALFVFRRSKGEDGFATPKEKPARIEDPAALARKKLIRRTVLAIFAAFTTYCIWDGMWSVQLFEAAASGKRTAPDWNGISTAHMENLLRKSHGDRADAVRVILGISYRHTNKLQQAATITDEAALNLQNNAPGNAQLLAAAYENLAQTYIREKQYAKAEVAALRALGVIEQPNADQGGIRLVLNYHFSINSETVAERKLRLQELIKKIVALRQSSGQ